MTDVDNQKYAMVRKSNALIQEARYSLTVQQQKVVLYLISQIRPEDEDFKTYDFSIADFCKVANIDLSGGRVYRMVEDTLLDIVNSNFYFSKDDDHKIKETYHWIQDVCVNEETGNINVSLDPKMRPFLLQLRGNYAEYELVYTLRMKHSASIRLYEILVSYHFNDLEQYRRTIELDELRRMLGVDGKESYTRWERFRTKILDPAVNEINRLTDKAITYRPLKTGRKITAVAFSIGTKTVDERLKLIDDIEQEYYQLSMFDSFRRDWSGL